MAISTHLINGLDDSGDTSQAVLDSGGVVALGPVSTAAAAAALGQAALDGIAPVSETGGSGGADGSVTASAPVYGSIPTIGTYIAYTSPTSSLGHHFAAGSTVTVNLTGLHIAGEVTYAMTALAAWASVANIHFSYTTGAAQITITDNSDNTNYTAVTNTYWSGPTYIDTAVVQISEAWYNNNGGYGGAVGVLNSYGYQTFVHELGHALGLGHDGPYNNTATYGTSNIYTDDSWQFSTMSYFDQTNYGGASFAFITSAMQADIYGIQLLYGAPTTSSFWFGYGPTAGSEYDLALSNSFTIFSSTGYAYLDASQYSGAQTINMAAGTFSSVKGYSNNIGLALSTHLSEVLGGSGADTIYTGSTANGNRSIYAYGGNDYIYSQGSSASAVNYIDGGAGSDTVNELTSSAGLTFRHTNQSLNGWQITGSNTDDFLSNVEYLVTTDKTFTLRQTKADFDFTGTSDILLQDANANIVEWNLNSAGNIGSGAVVNNGSLAGWKAVGTGDFNADGAADILVKNGGTLVQFAMHNGVAGTGSGVVATGLDNWNVVGTGDFNNDGTTDILLQDKIYNNVVQWQMSNGAVVGGNQVNTGNNQGWTVVGTGDFNNDGTTDILQQNGGTFVEWGIHNGVAGAGSAVVATGANGWKVVGTGDFNGDGYSDILLQDANYNVVDWQMVNGVITGGGVVNQGAIVGWNVVATGDYNNDGTTDILLQNGGSFVRWVMHNGAAGAGSGVIATGANGWSVVS